MDTVILHSLPYQISVTVPREAILRIYPNSILAQALEREPTIDTIEIPSPDVTDIALVGLARILRTGKDQPFPTLENDYARASYYLNTDSLGMLGRPDIVKTYLNPNSLGPLGQSTIVKTYPNITEVTDFMYSDLLNTSLNQKDPYLSWFAFQSRDPNTTRQLDSRMLISAIWAGNIAMVAQLLKRGVDPTIQQINADGYQEYPLSIAVFNRNLSIVEMLLRQGADPTAFDNDALHHVQDGKTLDLLLSWNTTESAPMGADSPHKWVPRVDPSIDDDAMLRDAVAFRKLDLVEHLLQDPRVNPSARDNEALRQLLSGYQTASPLDNSSETLAALVKLIVENPRFNPISITPIPEMTYNPDTGAITVIMRMRDWSTGGYKTVVDYSGIVNQQSN